MAEGVGFEPTVPKRVHTLSRRAQSSTLAPLRESLENPKCEKSNAGFRRSPPLLPVPDHRVAIFVFALAEGVGFEPTVPQDGTTVFETAPINHSGTPPQRILAVAVCPPGCQLPCIGSLLYSLFARCVLRLV